MLRRSKLTFWEGFLGSESQVTSTGNCGVLSLYGVVCDRSIDDLCQHQFGGQAVLGEVGALGDGKRSRCEAYY
jgi:hypothetical protein